MAADAMNMTVVAHVADVRHNDEEVHLSCFNSEVERSVPATKLPMHNGRWHDTFTTKGATPALSRT